MASNWRFKCWEFGFDTATHLGAPYVLDPSICVLYRRPFNGIMYAGREKLDGSRELEILHWQLVFPGTEWQILEIWAGPD